MADLKVSQLTALTAAAADAADVVPVVDTSATTTKKISLADVAEYVSGATVITNLIPTDSDDLSEGATNKYYTTARENEVLKKAIVDAKGDLIVATAADTPARLAVGGTNGYVLTVDSAETAGVKWAVVDDTTKIAKSIVDAKGDLIVATANDTPARFAVGGTNGHVLTVDSAETAGVKWAAIPASTPTWDDDQNILANAIFG
jgi:hypothetical protein